jgi:hypothetical protein
VTSTVVRGFGRIIDHRWVNYNSSTDLERLKYTYDRNSSWMSDTSDAGPPQRDRGHGSRDHLRRLDRFAGHSTRRFLHPMSEL